MAALVLGVTIRSLRPQAEQASDVSLLRASHVPASFRSLGCGSGGRFFFQFCGVAFDFIMDAIEIETA